MRHGYLLIVFCLLLLLPPASVLNANGAPWPPDLSVVKPEANVPAKLLPLSGKWIGSTGSGMGARMAFEQIYVSEFGLLKIQSVYAWNNRFVPAGWSRQPARFTGKEIIFTIGEGSSLADMLITCGLPVNDSMSCTYSGPYTGTIGLRKEK